MKQNIGKVLSVIFLLATSETYAVTYSMPPANQALIGSLQYKTAQAGDNVVTVAMRYDIGFNAIENANPQLDVERMFRAGTPMQIPTQHLLPNLPRKGIVINLPEMRMYYYPAGTNEVLTYPIGIGKIGKTIPITKTSVARKTKNPVWIPTQNIREYNLQQGIVLPKIMPAGPDNPLGLYAIYTGLPAYLIHSSPFTESIGKRASFGCIRMYESDIENFYPSVSSGIPITIINSPIKVAWQDDKLYMEAYEPLEEHKNAADASLPGAVNTVTNMTKNQPTLIDWQLVSYIADEKDGIPHEVGIKIKVQTP